MTQDLEKGKRGNVIKGDETADKKGRRERRPKLKATKYYFLSCKVNFHPTIKLLDSSKHTEKSVLLAVF